MTVQWKVPDSSDFQSFLSVSVKTVSGSVLREAEKTVLLYHSSDLLKGLMG
jgi:hypothetical protein